MHGTIICGAIFGHVSSNLDFENKAAIDWNSVDFTSPHGQLELGLRISLKFSKFGLMFIRQFLGTSYHNFQRVFKEDLKRVSNEGEASSKKGFRPILPT